MTELSSTYIAEQAWTSCPCDVAARLLDVDNPTWLLPFLRLAGGDGEQGGARVLDMPRRGNAQQIGAGRTLLEEVELGDELVRHPGGEVGRQLLWRTAGFTVLFRRLDGELLAQPSRGGAVLALSGRYELPQSLEVVPNGRLAGRRAAEIAARSLLGHLRSALEEPSLEQMLA